MFLKDEWTVFVRCACLKRAVSRTTVRVGCVYKQTNRPTVKLRLVHNEALQVKVRLGESLSSSIGRISAKLRENSSN